MCAALLKQGENTANVTIKNNHLGSVLKKILEVKTHSNEIVIFIFLLRLT